MHESKNQKVSCYFRSHISFLRYFSMFALNKTAMFNKYGAEYDELNKETDYFVLRQIKSLLIKVASYLVAVFFLINV